MMKHHEDPFFDAVRNELYAMEVAPPAGVQAKVMSRVRSRRPVWVLNSLAAVLLCTAAIGAVSWNYYTDDCRARTVELNEPRLDAVLGTAQARIVDREEAMEASSVKLASAPASDRSPQVRVSVPKMLPTQEPLLELTELSSTQDGNDDLPRCPDHPEIVTPVAPENLTPVAAKAMSAADILKQAQSQADSVIRMSVKMTIPVNDKE